VTLTDIVLDASALVRALLHESEEAVEIVEGIADGSISAHAPDLIGPETANALLHLVRVGRSSPETAATMLEVAGTSEIMRYSSAQFVRPAFELAMETGLSAYDAFYAVLAKGLDIPLVTADRKLAAAVDGSVLVT
jgi:predicted nucleic acid-binding protein